MLAIVPEVLRHCTASVWGKELQRRGIGCSGCHNCGVLHAVILFEDLEELCHSGTLLSNRHVNAVEMSLLVSTGIDGLLVQHRIDGDGRLASLAIANDQLTLSTSNGDEAVHGLDPCGHGFMHTLAWNDSGCLQLDSPSLLGCNWSGTINGHAQRINNATEQLLSNRHVHNGASALYTVTFHNGSIITEHDDTDVVGLQVECHAFQAARELNHLSSLYSLQAIDAGNSVSDTQDSTHLLDILLVLEVRDAVAQYLCKFGRADLGCKCCLDGVLW
mmetsp:Transcript_2523/g.6362  ORF Transcript_2523/g.6362 Transcript_2523/m.6362 type:complete len:274 (-) Transcript_2523:162-983(-)